MVFSHKQEITYFAHDVFLWSHKLQAIFNDLFCLPRPSIIIMGATRNRIRCSGNGQSLAPQIIFHVPDLENPEMKNRSGQQNTGSSFDHRFVEIFQFPRTA